MQVLLPQSRQLAAGPLDVGVARSQHEQAPVSVQPVLHAAGHIGEVGVGDVQHESSDHTALADAKRTGGTVADEAELADRGVDAFPGRLRHEFRAVQHVRHGAH